MLVRMPLRGAVFTLLRARTTVHVRRIHSDPHSPMHALLPPHSDVVFRGERCDFPVSYTHLTLPTNREV